MNGINSTVDTPKKQIVSQLKLNKYTLEIRIFKIKGISNGFSKFV